MFIDLDVSLDPTLGCGQAHRWRRSEDGWWEGVLGDEIVRMRHADGRIEVTGTDRASYVLNYLGAEDDLEEIVSEISAADPYVASLASRCPGLRILRQEPWECMATYLLATNANVSRIGKMVESVCDTFGRDLGGRHAFPLPKEILDRSDLVCQCRLGFREGRFIELAQRVEDGEIDPEAIRGSDYRECVDVLRTINGIGPKVADCVAIFGYGHLNAFPVDVRIQRIVERMYGVTGSYGTVSEFGMRKFGRYAGYAQEFLYHADFIERSLDLFEADALRGLGTLGPVDLGQYPALLDESADPADLPGDLLLLGGDVHGGLGDLLQEVGIILAVLDDRVLPPLLAEVLGYGRIGDTELPGDLRLSHLVGPDEFLRQFSANGGKHIPHYELARDFHAERIC